jgi:TetR/AcrR family transcriptional regulator, regulator of autoinduction and epiphytic fitness
MQRFTLLRSAQERRVTDGRIARGERTRIRVAEAMIELLEQGEAQPTAKAVAQQAGVSLRLVFHHFEDMDALYRAVMVLQAQRHWSKLREVPPGLPVAHRIDRTVRQRGRLFDAIGPVRRVAVTMATRSEELAGGLAEADQFLRERLADTFEPELAAAGTHGRDLLESLDLVTSWEAWTRLRIQQHLSPVVARRVTARSLAALLGEGQAPAANGRL